jgi:ribulose-5-phosphate 4-epimerase/fuculose-1-phosphate aldolase
MSHHGAVVMGRDLEDAYNRMETLERISNVILTAKVLGQARPMPEKAFDHMLRIALNGKLD